MLIYYCNTSVVQENLKYFYMQCEIQKYNLQFKCIHLQKFIAKLLKAMMQPHAKYNSK